MHTQLVIRPDYGSTVPWVEHAEEGLTFLAGPNALYLRTPIETRGEDYTTIARFKVRDGERVPFTLAWSPSHVDPPPRAGPVLGRRVDRVVVGAVGGAVHLRRASGATR